MIYLNEYLRKNVKNVPLQKLIFIIKNTSKKKYVQIVTP